MVMLAGSGMTLGTGLVDLEQEAQDCERRARDGFREFCAEHEAQYRSRPEGGYFRKLEHGGRRGIGMAGPAGSGPPTP